jgi:hypothetical protein
MEIMQALQRAMWNEDACLRTLGVAEDAERVGPRHGGGASSPPGPLPYKDRVAKLVTKMAAAGAPAPILARVAVLTERIRDAETVDALMEALRVPVPTNSDQYGRLWELLKGGELAAARVCRHCSIR